jgi:uncharacterized membrane protein YccC
MAGSGVLAMATTLAVEFAVARASGTGTQMRLIAMLLGAIVAMTGSMALNYGSVRDKVKTAALFPVAIGSGLTLGTAVGGNRDLMLAVFVVVMFVAVFIRRFGPAYFTYGFMIWIGYFFASFLGAKFATLGSLIIDVLIASGWVLLLSVTVLADRADRTLRHTLAAFGARGCSLALTAAKALEHPDEQRGMRRLRSHQTRLNESALIIEGQLADPRAVPAGWSAPDVRQWLLDAHLSLDGLALAVTGYVSRAGAGETNNAQARAIAGVALMCRAIANGSLQRAERRAQTLRELSDDGSAQYRLARRASFAACNYLETLAHLPDRDAHHGHDQASDQDFEPAVTLRMGNLPGSFSVAQDVAARGRRWNPFARLDLITRQAFQVALAGALAIPAGQALSTRRYYWAVIAAFVMFSGTATRSETLSKALNRVAGTLAGLGIAIVLANATAGHGWAVLLVILASLFFGFYLIRISYVYMIFFVTIMVSQLYSVLHEFTDALLFTRLEETAIGAGCGILVALIFAPLSTRDTARSARSAFCRELAGLLRRCGGVLSEGGSVVELDGLARSVDLRFAQLNQVFRPLTRSGLFSSADAPRLQHELSLCLVCATFARALTAAVRRSPRSPDYGSACTALACAADALAAEASLNGGSQPAADELERAGAVLDSFLDPTHLASNAPVDWPLLRLFQVLRELAGPPALRGSTRVPQARGDAVDGQQQGAAQVGG